MPRTFIYRNEAKREEMELKVFGKKIDEEFYGDLAGDIENTAEATVVFDVPRDSLSKTYPIYIKTNNTVCDVTLRLKEGVVDISEMKAVEQQKGSGRKTFTLIANTAAYLGFKKLYGHAIRFYCKNPDWNAIGYYVFPRFGFEALIPDDVQAKLPSGLKGVTNISELMKTTDGRVFWRDAGTTIEAYFDLEEGSVSWEILNLG